MHLHASELHASELPVLVCCLSLRSKLFDQACFCTNQVARHSSWPEPHELFSPAMAWLALAGEDAGGMGAMEAGADGSEPGASGLAEGAEKRGKKGGRGSGSSKVRGAAARGRTC